MDCFFEYHFRSVGKKEKEWEREDELEIRLKRMTSLD